MLYTALGKTGLQVSRLGFGCMRLPMGEDGKVNRRLAIPLLRRAFELGITYFDTAVFYCGGDSQSTLGEAMEGIRHKVVLSTKNNFHQAEPGEWRRRLEDSLKFLRTDFIDVYNFHGLSWDAFEKNIRGPQGKLALMAKAKEEGLIRHICCSFHDTPEALVQLAETGFFESITLQYNMLSRQNEKAMYRLRELGVGIVVMGPVGGGRLGVPSARIREITDASSAPEAALRFVLAHPAVSLAISGMSSMEMLEENVRTVSEKAPFTPAQIQALDVEVVEVKKKIGVPCTACGYCLPCPHGVDIPGNFKIYNEFKMFGLTDTACKAYAGQGGTAALCSECQVCAPKCPQKIQIPDKLRRIVAALDASYEGFGASLVLRHARGAERLEAGIMVRNLTVAPIQPGVTCELEQRCRCEPAEVTFRKIAADSMVSKKVDVHVPDGVSALIGHCTARDGDTIRVRPVRIPFFIIPRHTERRHDAVLPPGFLKKRPDLASAFGYRVWLRHDDQAIRVRMEIRSAMKYPAPPGTRQGDRMEMFVDMRAPGREPLQAYEEGGEQFFIALAEPGCHPRSERAYRPELEYRRTADGCEIGLALHYRDFLKEGWTTPSAIGLDFMLVIADETGVMLAHPTYGGRQGLHQNPHLFTRAYLV